MTTLFKPRIAMDRKPLPNCHDGVGTLDWITVLAARDHPAERLRFMHDDIIPPGASIGVHQHTDSEELYYVLSGRGTMTLDGEQYPIGPGDIAVVYPGGVHGLENTGDEAMRIIVVAV